MDTLGKRIAFLIDKEGTNPNRLGKQLGIHPSTLKNYLDDKTRPHNLIIDKLSKYFMVSIDWLVSGEGQMVESISTVDSTKYSNESAIRMHMMIKDFVPMDMMDLWRKQLSEIVDLCEYKELYLKAKESLLGKKK